MDGIKMDTGKLGKERPSEISCTFCMKTACQDFVNIQQNAELLHLLGRLSVDIMPIENQIDWICYQCTYKLHCIRDYSRTWSSCITKSRINHYYKLGEKEIVKKLLNLENSKETRPVLPINPPIVQNGIDSSHNKNELKLKISSVRSLGVNDIPNTLITTESKPAIIMDEKEEFPEHIENNNENGYENTNEKEEFPEHIENNNENGYENTNGNDNENDNENHDEKENKTDDENENGNYDEIEIDEENYYNNETPEQELLSVMYEKSESVINTESGGHNLYCRNKKINTPTLLSCKDCHRVYKKLSFLKKHERKHERDNFPETITNQNFLARANRLKYKNPVRKFSAVMGWRKYFYTPQSRLNCPHCPAVFILSANFILHESTCGKTKKQKSRKCMTRSSHYTNDNNSETSEVDTMYTKRLENAKNWVNKFRYNKNNNNEKQDDELNDGDNDDCRSFATSFTRASSRIYEPFTQDEQDDDDFSTLAESKNTVDYFKKNIKKTNKLYEKNENHFKIDENVNLIRCPGKNCAFITTSTEKLQEHDLTVHDELPLFHCKKCNGRFLRYLYLKDHLKHQNPGRFICAKCEIIFDFERHYKFHLFLHERLDKFNDSNYCHFCNLRFLNVSDFYNHLESKYHKEKDPENDEKIKLEYIEHDENMKKVENEIINVEEDNTVLEDLFKDEKKNLAYVQMMKEDDEVVSQKMDSETDIAIKIHDITDDENCSYAEFELKPDFNIKSENIDSSLFKSNKLLQGVEPYKSEIRIRKFSRSFRRRHNVIFRQWRPPFEPLRKIGANYLDCSIRPYRNS